MSTLQEAQQTDVGDEDDRDVLVLAWWRNPLNIAALFVAATVLAGALGFVLGERNATPQSGAVDVGFLHDMRTHHEQAVEMSLVYISKPNTSLGLRTIAKTIVFGQGIDIGRMIQLLRDFGASEANETGTAMAWMNDPVPEEQMPGMASGSDQQALLAATGNDADQVFARLMIAHHQGGIHMSDHAALYAKNDEVRLAASQISESQANEIFEIQGVQANG